MPPHVGSVRRTMFVTATRIRRAFGLLAVLLALAGRLAPGSMVVDVDARHAAATLLDTMVQCQADAPGARPAGPPRPLHHEAEHAIDVLASLLDGPAPTMAPAPVLPPRPGAIVLHAGPPPPFHGPPSHPPGAPLPRGPPALA